MRRLVVPITVTVCFYVIAALLLAAGYGPYKQENDEIKARANSAVTALQQMSSEPAIDKDSR